MKKSLLFLTVVIITLCSCSIVSLPFQKTSEQYQTDIQQFSFPDTNCHLKFVIDKRHIDRDVALAKLQFVKCFKMLNDQDFETLKTFLVDKIGIKNKVETAEQLKYIDIPERCYCTNQIKHMIDQLYQRQQTRDKNLFFYFNQIDVIAEKLDAPYI